MARRATIVLPMREYPTLVMPIRLPPSVFWVSDPPEFAAMSAAMIAPARPISATIVACHADRLRPREDRRPIPPDAALA